MPERCLSSAEAQKEPAVFDTNKLVIAFVGGLMAHINPLLMYLYYLPPDLNPTLPLLDSPLKRHVELLVNVANKQSQYEDDVREALLAVSLVYEVIPPYLRTKEMKALIDHAAVWLNRDELITHSEAARILRNGVEKSDLMTVTRLIQRGKLTRFTDPNEPNPTRSGRVLRSEVERLRDVTPKTE